MDIHIYISSLQDEKTVHGFLQMHDQRLRRHASHNAGKFRNPDPWSGWWRSKDAKLSQRRNEEREEAATNLRRVSGRTLRKCRKYIKRRVLHGRDTFIAYTFNADEGIARTKNDDSRWKKREKTMNDTSRSSIDTSRRPE